MPIIPPGCSIDISGNVCDLDGTVLEICVKCNEYCLPENVLDFVCICESCQDPEPKQPEDLTSREKDQKIYIAGSGWF